MEMIRGGDVRARCVVSLFSPLQRSVGKQESALRTLQQPLSPAQLPEPSDPACAWKQKKMMRY